MTAPHPLMTTAELCALFRVTPQSVARRRVAGKLTVITMPCTRTPRYLRAEVEALVRGKPLTPEQIAELRATLLDSAP